MKKNLEKLTFLTEFSLVALHTDAGAIFAVAVAVTVRHLSKKIINKLGTY